MKCRKCGYVWTPHPEKWNNLPEDGEKLLKCPVCFNWNKMIIGETEVAVILKKEEMTKALKHSEQPLAGNASTLTQQKPSGVLERIQKKSLERSARTTRSIGSLMRGLKNLEKTK